MGLGRHCDDARIPGSQNRNLPRQQDTQKAHWLRWRTAANVAGAILFAVVMFKVAMFKVAMTGEDPPIAMIVIALIVSFVGAGFTTVGRLLALSR
jgi:hypothetical protein